MAKISNSASGINFTGEMPNHIKEVLDGVKTEYRQLGKSGLKVSVPILGAMSFGNKKSMDWVLDEEEALPVLKAAYDRGVNTWDTACNYSNGESERIVGAALKKYNIPRRKVVIMTKCFGITADDVEVWTVPYTHQLPYTKDYANQCGVSRASLFTNVERSLERLGTSYIDVYQVHRFDYNTPIEETMKALHDLVEMGKVRYIGASSMCAYQFAMMQAVAEKNGWTKFISMQNHYSLLYREEEREMNRFCNETGVGLIPWSPLCRGHLARPRASINESARGRGEAKCALFDCGIGKPDDDIVDRVEELAKKKGWTMTQVSLAWINKRTTSPIVGFSKIERIDDALQAWGKTLSDEEEQYLEELYVPKNVIGHR